MKIRKLTAYEQVFVSLNSQILEIQYYPHKAKTHRVGVSIFKINKGYAFLMSNKILRHFKKCEIVDIIEHTDVEKHYKSIKEALLGGK